jgi:hypothetical protein
MTNERMSIASAASKKAPANRRGFFVSPSR